MRAIPFISRWLNLRKGVCFFLLVFQAIFLNVVLPGHTRGTITLSGKNNVTSLRDVGCPLCAAVRRTDEKKKQPDPRDQADCAICHLALRLTIPAAVDFRLTDFGLLEVAPLPAAASADDCRVIPTYFGRGPPQVA